MDKLQFIEVLRKNIYELAEYQNKTPTYEHNPAVVMVYSGTVPILDYFYYGLRCSFILPVYVPILAVEYMTPLRKALSVVPTQAQCVLETSLIQVNCFAGFFAIFTFTAKLVVNFRSNLTHELRKTRRSEPGIDPQSFYFTCNVCVVNG